MYSSNKCPEYSGVSCDYRMSCIKVGCPEICIEQKVS